MPTTEPTQKGRELIEAWHRARMHKRALERKLTKAHNEALTTEQALAEWLLPTDAKHEEKFCMWYGDTLVQAWHESGYKYVDIRTQGRDLMR